MVMLSVLGQLPWGGTPLCVSLRTQCTQCLVFIFVGNLEKTVNA